MPDEPRAKTVELRRRLAREALTVIDADFARDLRISDVAAQLGTSERQLQRSMQEATGRAFRLALAQRRLQETERLLRQTELTVTQIASAVGYRGPSHLAKVFREAYGQSPRRYRTGDAPARRLSANHAFAG